MLLLRQKLKFFTLPITSSLGKVPPARGVGPRPLRRDALPAIRWSVASSELEDTDQGLPGEMRMRGRRRAGGDEETRTPDPLLAKEMLFQLSYVPSPVEGSAAGRMVGVSGLEPETSALSGQCSNQLS